MKDREFYIYDSIKDFLEGIYGDSVFYTSEYTESPEKFPAVSIIQANSSVREDRRTTFVVENGAQLLYEVNVFSNRLDAKIQAGKIMDNVNEAFAKYGFVRTLRRPVQNYQSPSIYRIVARFEASIGIDDHIYAP